MCLLFKPCIQGHYIVGWASRKLAISAKEWGYPGEALLRSSVQFVQVSPCMLAICFFPFKYIMKTQSVLELSDVQAIAAAAQAEAQKNNWNVSIAIVDAGGHLLHFQRLNGAPPISSHIAPAKAHTAALGQRESKVYEDVINGGRYSFLSAPAVAGMLEGGVPIMKDGACLGAVGVSGVKSNEDAQIAKAGIAAIGL